MNNPKVLKWVVLVLAVCLAAFGVYHWLDSRAKTRENARLGDEIFRLAGLNSQLSGQEEHPSGVVERAVPISSKDTVARAVPKPVAGLIDPERETATVVITADATTRPQRFPDRTVRPESASVSPALASPPSDVESPYGAPQWRVLDFALQERSANFLLLGVARVQLDEEDEASLTLLDMEIQQHTPFQLALVVTRTTQDDFRVYLHEASNALQFDLETTFISEDRPRRRFTERLGIGVNGSGYSHGSSLGLDAVVEVTNSIQLRGGPALFVGSEQSGWGASFGVQYFPWRSK
jgi:hypothetical protein